MMDSGVLNESLKKKNKELDMMTTKMNETKREYDMKVKNLMGGIATLQKQNTELENQSKDNHRVEIIKKLKQERKDQEQVINLLRKYIANDIEVDKYLLNEFKRSGDQRLATYEELKILNKQLQSKVTELKLKGTSSSPIPRVAEKKALGKSTGTMMDETQIQLKMTHKFKDQIREYEDEKTRLIRENESLKENKEKMEAMQTELFNKLKTYNQEVGEMKSIYDVMKGEFEEENVNKVQGFQTKITRLEKENGKLKEKVFELIKIGEEREKESLIKISKLQREHDIMAKLLQTKKTEVEVYNEELDKYKGQLNHFDTKDMSRNRKLEDEKYEIIKRKTELEEQVSHSSTVIKQKDDQIKHYKEMIDKLNEMILEKDMEIELYTEKLNELEKIKKK